VTVHQVLLSSRRSTMSKLLQYVVLQYHRVESNCQTSTLGYACRAAVGYGITGLGKEHLRPRGATPLSVAFVTLNPLIVPALQVPAHPSTSQPLLPTSPGSPTFAGRRHRSALPLIAVIPCHTLARRSRHLAQDHISPELHLSFQDILSLFRTFLTPFSLGTPILPLSFSIFHLAILHKTTPFHLPRASHTPSRVASAKEEEPM
jgi:hypothetical protein